MENVNDNKDLNQIENQKGNTKINIYPHFSENYEFCVNLKEKLSQTLKETGFETSNIISEKNFKSQIVIQEDDKENKDLIKNYFNFDFSNNSKTTVNDKNENISEELINSYSQVLSKIKKGGVMAVALQKDFLINFCEKLVFTYLKNNNKETFFIKVIIIDNLEQIVIITLTKLENKSKSETQIESIKTRVIELYEEKIDNVLKYQLVKIKDIELMKISTMLSYLFELYRIQLTYRNLAPGFYNEIEIKLNPDSDKIDYTFIISDSKEFENNVVGFILNETSSFEIFTIHGYNYINRYLQSNRVIIIKPNYFNKDTCHNIKEYSNWFANKFIPIEFKGKEISIMVSDNVFSHGFQEHEIIHKSNDNFKIFDFKENNLESYLRVITNCKQYKEPTFRKMHDEYLVKIPINYINQSEKGDNIKVLPTSSYYKNKKLVACRLENKLVEFEHQFSLCSFFYMKNMTCEEDKLKINEQYPEVLILNSETGELCSAFKFINSNVTAVEENSALIDLGKTYLNSYDDIKLFSENSSKFLNSNHKKLKNKFDIIVNVPRMTKNNKLKVLPDLDDFSDKTLENLLETLNENGVYMFCLRHEEITDETYALNQIFKYFQKVYCIENLTKSNRLYFALKRKIQDGEILYVDTINPNMTTLLKHVNFQPLIDEMVFETFMQKMLIIK